jgi:hypothetical protein
MMRSALLLALFASACAETSATERAVDRNQLTSAQAERLISAYVERRSLREVATAGDPLRAPKSEEDLLAILRKDQIDLFPAAIEWATAHPTPSSTMLQAQTELAWGEALEILADFLERSTKDLHKEAERLDRRAARQALNDKEKARRERVGKILHDIGEIDAALENASGRHLATGSELAQKLVESAPSDYHGYRIAADYYRIKANWQKFDEMMSKLEQSKPDSTGGIFERGMEALERSKDPDRAKGLFKHALEKDAQFARAEVQLLIAQDDVPSMWAEYEKLKKMNPRHQLVIWVGPAIEERWRLWNEEQQRANERTTDRASPQ